MTATATPALPATLVDALERELDGVLLRPGCAAYEETRRVWNARVDRRPALIARCATVDDVCRGVRFARDVGIKVSVRGSGHHVSGRAIGDGALTLDLRRLGAVDVDPRARVVRAQAGVTWGRLDARTQDDGLATTGARISTIGIAGVTLGGGYGWLMRKHGLTIDNLRLAEVVTADGRLVTASPGEHRDLFWGLRGGAGGLGVVTAFEFALHDVGPLVTCGVIYHPVARIRELLRRYRAVMADAPEELALLFNVVVAPAAPFVPPSLRGVPVAALAVAHFGSARQARRDLAPLRGVGEPLLELVKPRPYATLQKLFDPAGAYGYRVYSRSGHLPELTDEVIEAITELGPSISSPRSVVMVSPLGGAVARVGEHETAFGYRTTRFDCSIDSVWASRDESDRHIAWTESLWSAIRPFTLGAYVNELGEDGDAGVQQAYIAPTRRRLAALREAYDPHGAFDVLDASR